MRRSFVRVWWRLVALVVGVGTGVSAQNWPVERGSYDRRAGMDARAALGVPAVRWSFELGGGLRGLQWLLVTDEDGSSVVVGLQGGRVTAWSRDGDLRWATEPLGIQGLDGLVDVDRDDRVEIVGHSLERGLYFLDPADGSVRHHIAPSEVSRFGEAWTADFDGDGNDELYVSDRNCGPPRTCTGRIYRLNPDFPSAPVVLDRSGYDYWLGLGHTAADLDGDGSREVVSFDDGRVVVHDAGSGAERWSLDVGRFPYARGRATAADLDGDGRDEVVVGVDTAGAPGAKRMFVVELESSAMRVRWEDRFDPAEGDHSFLGRPVGDLFSDVAGLEVVTSVFVPGSGRWETRIYAGRGTDSTPLQVLPDRIARVIVEDAAGSATGLLLQRTSSRYVPALGRLELWVDDGSGRLREEVSLEGARPLLTSLPLSARAERWQGAAGQWWVARDEDGDGFAERFATFDGAFARPFSFGMAVLDARPDGTGGMFVTTSLGDVFSLSPFGELLNVSPDAPGRAALRVAVYRAPGLYVDRMARSEGPLLLVRDAGGRLVAYRPPGGTAEQPVRQWWSSEPLQPAVLGRPSYAWLPGRAGEVVGLWRGEDGGLFLGVHQASDGRSRARLRIGGGGEEPMAVPTWLAEARRVLVGVVPLSDFAQNYRLLDITLGTMVQPTPLDRPLRSSFDRPPLRFDVGAEGVFEWLVPQGDNLTVLAADATSVLRRIEAGTAGTPAAFDMDGDGTRDVLHSGGLGVMAFDEDLNERWRFDRRGRYRIGVADERSMAPAHVCVPDARAPRVVLLDGASGEPIGEAFLSGGERFDTLAGMETAGQSAGFLSDAVGLADLGGDGQPACLVGSSDGYLYALSFDDLSLRWALDLKAAVGYLAVADFDDDGAAEVLAATADGRVRVIDTAELRPPDTVYDTDGTFVAGSLREDRDQLPANRIGANWEPVAGAAFYEVQLERESDRLVVVPWTEASGGTRHRFDGLTLPTGERFVIRVRAVASGRSALSPEASSDGFLTLEPAADVPDGGSADGGPTDGGGDGGMAEADAGGEATWAARGGCGCRLEPAQMGEGLPTAGLVMLVVLGRFRRRRCRGRR